MSKLEKDVQTLSSKEIKTLIKNYQAAQATDRPYYQKLIAEVSQRECRDLYLEKSIAAISQAARQSRYISYGEVAQASDCVWNNVRHPMNQHLQRVIEYCHARKMPLLSSIVVNQPGLESGEMHSNSLSGFVRGVEDATGVRIKNAAQFLREEQARVFAWAKGSFS
jgi:hypothetical protein